MVNIWERIHLADMRWGAGEGESLSDTRVSDLNYSVPEAHC